MPVKGSMRPGTSNAERRTPSIEQPTSEIVGVAGLEQVQFFSFGGEFFGRGFVVDFNRREGVVVNTENFVAVDEIAGFDGVVGAHGEIIADAERGEFQLRGFTD
jgi:hypothetical protein